MKKIISNYLENVNEIEWENGKTEISLKCRDEAEKEIGEVLVDDEAITYRFKNLESDTYSVRRYLREILKNRRTERDNEKIYIDGKLFGERKGEECLAYCDTENEVEFLDFVKYFDDIGLTFSNLSGTFRVKFSIHESVPKYIKLADRFFMEKKDTEEIIETENGIKQIWGKELEVEANDIVVASSVLKWIMNYKYDNVHMAALMIRKSIIKKLPKNNLTDNCNKIWDVFKDFVDNVEMTPEMIYVLSNFGYAPSMIFEKALETVAKAAEDKRIGSFDIKTEKGVIIFDPLEDAKVVLKSENGLKMASVMEDFDKVSEYADEFELEYYKPSKDKHFRRNLSIANFNERILVSKRNFAKTDFKHFRELSERTGKEITLTIDDDYDRFKIDGGTLKIEVSPYYDDRQVEQYKEKFSGTFQYFEKIETYIR